MTWDPIWDEIFRVHPWGRYPSEDVIRFVARNFYSVPDRGAVQMLDVGCGPGANLWFLAREGFRVFGIDGSARAIDAAMRRLDAECPGWKGELRVGDIGKLPYPGDSFDCVIDNEAVYANPFDASVKMYAEFFRVTKAGGKLYTKMFAAGCTGQGSGKAMGHNAWIPNAGPLAECGFTRFTERAEIDQLLGPYQVCSIDLATRTDRNRAETISEWIVIGEKPGGEGGRN